MLDKSKRYLLILESPNKKATVSSILKELGYNNVVVMASIKHITKINDSGVYNMGIDPANNFAIDYVVSPDKKDIVSKLKDQVKAADEVILMTDEDREGEAISYHLKNVLKLNDKKYIRCTTHEITKGGIQKALENPRKLDNDLVNASQARSCADKIIGYRLSGIARNNVGARSVGRCQSAGLKLIVEREEEIRNFKPEKYYDFYLHFKKNLVDFTAKYKGTDVKDIKCLKSLDDCKIIAEECKKGNYSILSVEHKDSLENPKPPFITSTYQQEVSKKLGLSVKVAMDIAQKLFEGIEVNGKHISLITYHRTDSSELSESFKQDVENFIKNNYCKDLYKGGREVKKSKTAQEGHEAIRPVDVNLTPQKLKSFISDGLLLSVYTLIWKRAVQSLLKPAKYEIKTLIIANGRHRFETSFKRIKSKGFKELD